MKNLLTVLKKLGKKMTGSDIAGTNLVTVVDDIANKYTGGGGSGGSGCDCQPTVLHTTFDPDAEITDMTAGEVFSIIESGKPVVIIADDNSNTEVYSVFKALRDADGTIGIYALNTSFAASSADEYLAIELPEEPGLA